MGNSASADPRLLNLRRRFSETELAELEHLFRSLAAQSRSGGEHIIASVFQSYYGIHGTLGSRLFDLIAQDDQDGLLSFPEFISAKAIVQKGSDEELDAFTFRLADILRTGNVTRMEAEHVVMSAMTTVFGPGRTVPDEIINGFVSAATFTGHLTTFNTRANSMRNLGPIGPSGDDEPTPRQRHIVDRSSSAHPSTGNEWLSTLQKASVNPAGPEETTLQDARLQHTAGDTLERAGSAPPSRPEEKDPDGASQREPDLDKEAQEGERRETGGAPVESGLVASKEQCDRPPKPSSARPEVLKAMTERDFKGWMERVPSLKRFLRSLLTPPPISRTLPGERSTSHHFYPAHALCNHKIPTEWSGRRAPQLIWSRKAAAPKEDAPVGGSRFLMRGELAWHLSGMLNEKEAEGPWRMMYSSSVHGLSFSTFMGKCADIPVPALIVIRDKVGCVFGAVFSQPLHKHSAFFGDMKTFLYSFLPTAAIYKPSGLNQNIQWCAQGFTSESIPNGVGFGGQICHFGLFLDSSIEKGHSWPCLTYRSPALSKSPEFDVDVIECWSIGQPEEDEQQDDKKKIKGTILERFKEEKALLGFAGVATASDSLSKEEPDPTNE